MIACRADVVGSLLRPPELRDARARRDRGGLSPEALRAVEDGAVDAAIALQEEAGLDAVSDGEMRRLSFQSVFTEAVDGLAPHGLEAFLWGSWHGDGAVGNRVTPRPAGLGVVGRLRRRRSLACEELAYLVGRTRRIAKISLPSPSLFVNFWSGAGGPYATCEAMLADVVDILRAEVRDLARLGATYVQLDAPHYTALLDREARRFYEAAGWSGEEWLARGPELDNAVMEPIPGVTYGLHLCRGNQESRWLVRGAYDPIAPVFQRTRAARLLLEYDDARSGGFEALRLVPEDKVVVLGLVTTKSPALEEPARLEARVREAERFIPGERLALSTQCGFASSIVGNRLGADDQRRKLALVGRTARRLWGADGAAPATIDAP